MTTSTPTTCLSEIRGARKRVHLYDRFIKTTCRTEKKKNYQMLFGLGHLLDNMCGKILKLKFRELLLGTRLNLQKGER